MTSRARGPSRADLAWAGTLLAITVLAYLPALQNGFIWDDNHYVTENLVLRSFDGLQRLWLQPQSVPQYYPVTFTSFWLEYHLWGLQPFGYHFVNVLLHAANAGLLWLVLRRIGVRGAWMAAALFAVHPMQVESVAWITERKNVLSGLFFFAAFLAYLEAETPDVVAGHVGIRWRPYLMALALFIAALLSKSVTCSLPAVLLLVLWWQRGALDRRTVLRLGPMFAVGLIMAGITVWIERYHVGAEGQAFSLTAIARTLVAGRVLWFYPHILLWPHNLTFIYPRWTIDTHVWWQYVFPAAATAAIAALFLARGRIGRGPLVAALCYAGALTPALGFISAYPMRYSFVADHFAYLPIAGLMVLAVAGGARLLDRVPDLSRAPAQVALGGSVLLTLGLLTTAQAGVYRDLRTLWTDTVAKNPGSWMAHNNLGTVLNDAGDVDGAVAHYLESLRLNPDDPEAHTNLGNALAGKGQLDVAISHYRAALQLQPGFATAHHDLGIALKARGRIDEAAAEFREAVRLQPDNAEAHYALGLLSGARGNTDEAINQFTLAAQARPDFADAQYNLAVALGMVGKIDQAVTRYRETLRIRPDDAKAHNNLGTVLAQAGRVDEAVTHFNRALQLNSNYPEARNNLGIALRQAGRLDEAIAEFEEAVRLQPSYAQAQSNLRAALAARDQARSARP
jgi:tetratricopeptide (TPR) repeat protein